MTLDPFSGFFISAGLSAMAAIPPPLPPATGWYRDITWRENPYGILSVGWEADLSPNFVFTFELRHQSSIPAYDRGENTAGINLRYFPFRR
jgi:hypothetical protein